MGVGWGGREDALPRPSMVNQDHGAEPERQCKTCRIPAGFEMGVGQVGCGVMLLVAAASVLAASGISAVVR